MQSLNAYEGENLDRSENELYEHHNFTAAKGQEPLRVDKFLMNFIEFSTRNKIQQAAKDGHVWVNGAAVKQNYKVKPGDEVKVMFEHPPHDFLLVPEDIPLHIVYEDDALLIVNKPPGMVVHPGHGNYSGTLINALLHHTEDLPEPTVANRTSGGPEPEKGGSEKRDVENRKPDSQKPTSAGRHQELPQNSNGRPGLVHRIDKDTSGLLVVAKTENAMTHLAKQFFDKTSEREYVALVWGDVKDDSGTVEGNIARNPKNRLQMQVFPEGDEGKEAVTHYEVIERLGYVTLVSCQLETGRTHQIRVHMKHIGHTLFNDERYGGDRILKGTTFTKYKQFVDNAFKILPRQALHAKTLGFVHPETGEKMCFDSEIPDDMAACIEKWRHYAKHR